MKALNSKSDLKNLFLVWAGCLSLVTVLGCGGSSYTPSTPDSDGQYQYGNHENEGCGPGLVQSPTTGLCVLPDTAGDDGSDSGDDENDDGGEVSTSEISGAQQVASGRAHSCVLLQGGDVKCFGDNSRRQIGPATTELKSDAAVTITGLNGVSSLVAGRDHTCALKGNEVYCWGANEKGQLGIGSTADRATPTRVSTITNAVAITAGDSHTCALRSNARVTCWGSNSHGQLGSGQTVSRVLVPDSDIYLRAVEGYLGGVSKVVAGRHFTCIYRGANGVIYCAGDNAHAQLARTDVSTSRYAVKASDFGVYGRRAKNVYAGLDHACARIETGEIQCWGRNQLRQLMGTTTASKSATPRTLYSTYSGITAFQAGGNRGCAAADGGLECWGQNFNSGSSSSPSMVPGIFGKIKSLGIGYHHACAVGDDNKVRCWGMNDKGQLGDPSIGTYSASAVSARSY